MPHTPIHLHLQRFADLDPEARQRLLAHLTPEDEASLVQHAEARGRQALARGLLRELLGAALRCPPAQLSFIRTPHGKPYLAGHDLSFNLSHSQEAIAIAWSPAALALGVDVEDRHRDRQTEALARRKFSPAELHSWETAVMPAEQWLAIWTRKEALLKAHGMGIRIDLRGVDTASQELSPGQFEHPVLGRMGWRSWADPEQVLSLAWADEPPAPVRILLHTPEQNLQEL